MTNEERTMLIQDKSLWKANEVLDENGKIKSPSYCDSFSVVSLKGKKAIVLCVGTIVDMFSEDCAI